MTYLALGLGFFLLFAGGEALVRGAVGSARLMHVSPLLVGLLVVAFATSSPELVVSLDAALRGEPDIAVGNIVGSNTANILLILGTGALIRPLPCQRQLVFRDGMVMTAATVALVILGLTGTVDRVHGVLLLVGLAAFIGWSFVSERRGSASAKLRAREAEEVEDVPTSVWANLALLVVGLAMLLFGSNMLVTSAVTIARGLGVPPTIIGLSIVAFGTSLPELATVVVAAWRGHADVAIGNVIGSCVFNILAILGVTSIVVPVPIGPRIMQVDMWVMLGATLLLIPMLITGWRLGRREGLFFVLLYVAYIGWMFGTDSGSGAFAHAIPG